MPTEVRILRSSSTSAIVGIFLFILVEYVRRVALGAELEQNVADMIGPLAGHNCEVIWRQNPEVSPADEARILLRRARTARLATLNADDGTPYASLVNVATDVGAAPDPCFHPGLAHAQPAGGRPRAASWWPSSPPPGDALTGPRVTVMGRFVPRSDRSRCGVAIWPAIRRRRSMPASATSLSGGMEPELAHAVAGFGRIETIAADEVFPSGR